jgi:hypothetical protein
VGSQRVTIQPNISGDPDARGLQLRVDGVLTTVPYDGLTLASGGRIVNSPVSAGFEIDFPNRTTLIVTPLFLTGVKKWSLNIDVFRAPATEGLPKGIMGTVPPNDWLPLLPDNTSLGPMPSSLHQRFVDLYKRFTNAWRVTDTTSLFDYAPGTSSTTFTLQNWPPEKGPCTVQGQQPANPDVSLAVAENLCKGISDRSMNANCVFDVRVTGEPGFAKLYLLSQKIRVGSTTTTLTHVKETTKVGEMVTFTATVAPRASSGRGVPTGTVQFMLDSKKVKEPVKLDSNGQAIWKTSRLKVGGHKVAARYIPAAGPYLTSISPDILHAVEGENFSKQESVGQKKKD